MQETSPNLVLPYLQPAQAQKHVTHNEALQILDTVVQLSVEGFGMQSPPALPAEGTVYALGAAPIADWQGHGLELAAWINGAWQYLTPQTGWRAWGRQEAELRVWTGTAWEARGSAPTDNLDHLGVGTTADSVNRLSVASPGSLFTHEGAGHRMALNKASEGDTASLLFQDNWSGRAEMGLAGSDDWSIKVSADGASWIEALRFAAATGLPSGAAVQASATDTTAGRLMRADYGYGPGNLLGAVSADASGAPSGAVIERGSNANGQYTRFADGTQICWTVVVIGALGGTLWTFPAAFVDNTASVTGTVKRAAARFVTASPVNPTDTTFYMWGGTSEARGLAAMVQATGRWY